MNTVAKRGDPSRRKGEEAVPWGTMGCSQLLKAMMIHGTSGSRAGKGFPQGKLVEQGRRG